MVVEHTPAGYDGDVEQLTASRPVVDGDTIRFELREEPRRLPGVQFSRESRRIA